MSDERPREYILYLNDLIYFVVLKPNQTPVNIKRIIISNARLTLSAFDISAVDPPLIKKLLDPPKRSYEDV